MPPPPSLRPRIPPNASPPSIPDPILGLDPSLSPSLSLSQDDRPAPSSSSSSSSSSPPTGAAAKAVGSSAATTPTPDPGPPAVALIFVVWAGVVVGLCAVGWLGRWLERRMRMRGGGGKREAVKGKEKGKGKEKEKEKEKGKEKGKGKGKGRMEGKMEGERRAEGFLGGIGVEGNGMCTAEGGVGLGETGQGGREKLPAYEEVEVRVRAPGRVVLAGGEYWGGGDGNGNGNRREMGRGGGGGGGNASVETLPRYEALREGERKSESDRGFERR